MPLVKHFTRLVYAQVLLGIVAFCMAERNPGLLLVAGAIAALSWYVTQGPSGKPLPWPVLNLASLAAVGWLVWELMVTKSHVIVAMGHLIMALQIVMLYAEKHNRDYVQLIVMSLLQMVGASVLSVSMVYGVLLLAYCALALYTVLLFQLKATADQVHESHKAAASKARIVGPPKAVVGRGHRWQFRFTALGIGLACFGLAMVVFIVVPRSGESRTGGQLAGPMAKRAQTGFSNRVDLGSTPGPARSSEPVLNLRLSVRGKSLNGIGRPLLLRGAVMDTYQRSNHTWIRSSGWGMGMQTLSIPKDDGHDDGLELIRGFDSQTMLHAEITLRSTERKTLFTIQPPASIDSESFNKVRFSPVDHVLKADQSLSGASIYSLGWPVNPSRTSIQREANNNAVASESPSDQSGEAPQANHMPGALDRTHANLSDDYGRGWAVQPERVAGLARKVLENQGLSIDRESQTKTQRDHIARALARYLSTKYRYTLENPPVRKAKDPVIDFLFHRKRGHCELFAAAHAAMCRSLGLKARVITGYRAGEFNEVGGYYVVRPDDAHAWTEVYMGPQYGWKTFDATPAQAVEAEHAPQTGWLSDLQGFYEYAEYLWIRTIVAYDQRTRAAVMDDLGKRVETTTEQRKSWVGQVMAFIRELPRNWRLEKIGYTAAGMVIVMLGLALASLTRLLILRRRKLTALQLTALPRTRRRGLARKLRFYLNMLEMLERHGYSRPEWQSPFGFARELADANPLRFDPVVSLTEIFYEVRFGHREMDDDRHQRVRAHLKALERALAERRTG